MTNNTNLFGEPRETLSPNLTTTPQAERSAELSILTRALWEQAGGNLGALTYRETIERARAILAARSHAAECVARALRMAEQAATERDRVRYTESALRFAAIVTR